MKQDHATVTPAEAGNRRCHRLLRRIFDMMARARERDLRRNIGRVIGQTDGHLSDELERRITLYLTRHSRL